MTKLRRRDALALVGLMAAGRPAVAATPPLAKIRIIDQPNRWASYELIITADKKGFFQREGLELDLIPLPPDQYTVALDSGVTDFAPASDYAYFINVRDKGLKVKEVVASTPIITPARANDGLFVLAGSPIQKPEDLRGKRIGMTNLSFSSAWFTLNYLRRAGLSRDDVTYVAIPALQQEQVLLNGDLDAIYAFSPIDAILRRKGGYRQLFALSDLAGRPIQRGGTMAKDDFIRDHPDVVRRYVTAIAKTADWANQHPGEVVQIGIDSGRIDAALAPFIYTKDGKGDYSVLAFAEHGLVNRSDVDFWIDVDEREGVVPTGSVKSSDVFTNAFNPFASGSDAKAG